LKFSIPNSAKTNNKSYYEDVPAVAEMCEVYFGNKYVFFDAQNGDCSYAIPVGNCTKENMCRDDESLITVSIDTSDVPEYIPSFFGSWLLYDTDRPADRPVKVEFLNSFDRGYPARSQLRSYMYVSDALSLAFGMFNSVPLGVTWSVEKNGVPRNCQTATRGDSDHSWMKEIISTPVSEACDLSLAIGSIVGILFGVPAAAFLGV
jgi:hypothetical protein